MTTLHEAWKALQGIDPRSGVAGAVLLALILALGRYVLLPVLRWFFGKLAKLLYPLLSGTFLLDRFWSLPRYRDALRARVSEITNPWLTKGQRLTDIFVPVSARGGESASERVELGALFREFPRIVLKGEPGSGKTTGLKAIALRCLRRELTGESGRELVPVFISLRQLAKDNVPFDDFVLKQFADLQFPKADRTVRRLIRKRRLVFLLDGLDEVEETERSGVIQQIRTLIQSHNDQKTACHVLLTSRPVGYDGQLDGIVDRVVEMAEFTPSDIRQFVRNWEFEPPKSHDDLLDCILTRPPILLISQNPLMLTIITYLYGHTQYELPKSREEFYKTCLEALLRAWDAAKNIGERNKIPAALKSAFLKRFAFQSLEQSRLDFDAPYLLDEIEAFRGEKKITEGTASDFLAELRRSGLLGSLPTGEIFFAHKTLAESLAAIHLRGRIEQLSALWHAKPSAWLEVCSLYVADPDTSAGDIARLVEDARSAADWSNAITLAGEAHLCPEAQYRAIVQSVISDPTIWPDLDQRAINALAILGEESRAVLPTMLREGSDEVRARALRALGFIREPWATQLIVSALSDPRVQLAAKTALITFGPDAIPILRTVFAFDRCDFVSGLAGIEILEAIGGIEAFESMLPLIYSSSPELSIKAAKAAGKLLCDSALRSEFEHRSQDWVEKKSAARSSPAEAMSFRQRHYAPSLLLPWLGPRDEDHQEIYYRLITRLQHDLFKSGPTSFLEADQIAARLLIPSYLSERQSDPNARFPLAEALNVPDPAPELVTLKKLPSIERTLRALRSDPITLWSRIGIRSKSDIALKENTAMIVATLISLPCIAFLAAAILLGRMSWWYGVPMAFVLAFATLFSIVQKDLKILGVASFLAGFPVSSFYAISAEVEDQSLWKRLLFRLSGIMLPAMVAAEVYAIVLLGPRWLPLLIPLAVGGFFRFDESGNELIIFRRQNPLRVLLDNLETAEARAGSAVTSDLSKSPYTGPLLRRR